MSEITDAELDDMAQFYGSGSGHARIDVPRLIVALRSERAKVAELESKLAKANELVEWHKSCLNW